MRIVQEIEETAWRDFVDENECGNIFHTPEMIRVFSQAEGFQPEVWAALEDNNRIAALFLPIHNTVLDRPFLRQLTTRSVLYGGVLCTSAPRGRIALNLLLRAYNQRMMNRVLFTEVRNLVDMNSNQPILEQNGFAYEEHLNFLIDLNRPRQAVWKAVRSNAQRNIRKAQKSGVVIEEVEDAGGVTAAYDILEQVYKRIQVPLPHLSLFQATFEVLRPKEMVKILLAKIDDKTIGALTLLIYKGVVIYWYTGALREYSSYRANDLLVWQALEWACEQGYHTFDFGGAGKPDEEYGVRDFKAKFGGCLVNYGRNIHIHAPLRLRASQTGYQLLRRFL